MEQEKKTVKRILCYGDSNTWGHVPAKGTRYPDDVRWPGVMAEVLGGDYRVIEDSISGRTVLHDDPMTPKRCGVDNLGYSLLAHSPIDLMIVALGENDLRAMDAAGVRRNITRLIDMIRGADTLYYSFSPIFRDEKRILLIAPPHIRDEIETLRPYHALAHAAEESKKLAFHYEEVAKAKHTEFLDLAPLVTASLEDCIHLSPESHRIVGEAVAAKVKEIFG